MGARLHHGLSPARLRMVLGLLFVALAVPSAVLIVQTQRQLKWEALHQQRELAAELAERIDRQLQRLIATEDARGYADYRFLTVAGESAAAQMLQRSPLAQLPLPDDWPGLLGWFQVDPAGRFSTPLLPDETDAPALHGIGGDELGERAALRDALLEVLASNRLAERRPAPAPLAAIAEEHADADSAPTLALAREVGAPPAPAAPAAQVEFDRLNIAPPAVASPPAALGKIADLRFDEPVAERKASAKPEPAAMPAQRGRRLEQSALPLPAESVRAESAAVRIFESELDPFEFARLDSGHFVLFRRVWRNGERSIQGVLIEPAAFIRAALAEPFAGSLLASSADLLVAWHGDVVERVPGRASRGAYLSANDDLSGSLLHRSRLSAPLSGVELLWTLRQLPAAPGAAQLAWSGAVLFAVLLLGFFALYRLGLRQIRLAHQQHDFIAAVSHELKTPLTSIRMYGELLRAGWASEDKKREYHDYIHDESERLARLIANVLQLARLERNELQLELRSHRAETLFDLIRSKVQGQIERAGFEVEFRFDPACAGVQAMVDADALVQILINLVDNALKFSAREPRQRVEIGLGMRGELGLVFIVRDYGPGIPPALRRRIFELFFRAGNELTRETRGTGIGLALVRQLAHGMGGEIEVATVEPGAEFRLLLPCAPASMSPPTEPADPDGGHGKG